MNAPVPPRHLMLIGTGPLLESRATVMSGQCLRTWHFAAPLLEAGHRVTLATVPIPGATEETGGRPAQWGRYQGHRYLRLLRNGEQEVLPALGKLLRISQPDALVGINAWPAYLAARLNQQACLPFWADLNGWTMVEGQTRGVVIGHDRDYLHFWKLEVMVALEADRFSTVSQRQQHALYGELAMLGRLTRHHAGLDLVTPVPNAVHPAFMGLRRRRGIPPSLKNALPRDASIALWAGGFNTWTDVDLLVQALRRALDADPALHFVACGGPVLGHDEETYARFLHRAAGELPAGRWHALGWIPTDQVLDLHARAAVGINIDGHNTETLFGARNRLTNMMGAGLPVVTTEGTEIAAWIAARDLAPVVPRGDGQAFAAAIAEAARGGPAIRDRARRARAAASEEFAPAATLPAFLSWAADPRRASDAARPHDDQGAPVSRLRALLRAQAAQDLPFCGPPPEPSLRQCLAVVRRRLAALLKGP